MLACRTEEQRRNSHKPCWGPQRCAAQQAVAGWRPRVVGGEIEDVIGGRPAITRMCHTLLLLPSAVYRSDHQVVNFRRRLRSGRRALCGGHCAARALRQALCGGDPWSRASAFLCDVFRAGGVNGGYALKTVLQSQQSCRTGAPRDPRSYQATSAAYSSYLVEVVCKSGLHTR